MEHEGAPSEWRLCKDEGLAALIERHRVFLDMGDTDRPLFTVRRRLDMRPPPFLAESVGEGSLIRPQELDTEAFLDWYGALLEEDNLVPDDGLRPAMPYFSIPWMEGMLGCTVRVYRTVLYAEPFLNSWEELDQVRFSLDNEWFDKLMDFTRAMVARFGSRFPVCTSLLRGPGDMMASLRGRQELCLALYDRPDTIKTLAAQCARMWIEVAKAQLEIIPSCAGGYFSRYRIWMPGTTTALHIDFSSLISRAMFQELLLPCEREIAGSFAYPVYHMHASSLHVVDDLLEMENVAAIQVSVDESLPRPRLIQTLGKMQQRKPIIVQRLSRSDVEDLAEVLSPRGLCLTFLVDTLEEAQASIAWARERWPDR
jgi:hypothetical protein